MSVTNAGDLAAAAGTVVGGIPVGTPEYETRVMAGLPDAFIASVGDLRVCFEPGWLDVQSRGGGAGGGGNG